jgi:hypothetical protein
MNPISRETLPLLSFIVGLGVAVLLFHKPFQSRATLMLPVDKIEGQVIEINKKCYQYHAEDAQCEILPSK